MKKIIILIFAFSFIPFLNYSQQNASFNKNETPISGANNSALGVGAGVNIKGRENVFIGFIAGEKSITGNENVFLGSNSGFNTQGSGNVYVGARTGSKGDKGTNNVFLGYQSGESNNGYGNVFLGYQAGMFYEKELQNRLYIENSKSNKPLIWGDFKSDFVNINGRLGVDTEFPKSKLDLSNNYSDPSIYPNKITLWSDGKNNYFGFGISRDDLDYFSQANHRFYTEYNGEPGTEKMVISGNGNVGIGTQDPDEKLTVKGKIHTQEVKVDLLGAVTPDYVFEKYFNGKSSLNPDYKMPTLKEVEAFIELNNHLPNVPSSQDIQENGLHLKEMNLKLLEKIEELTLYTIEQQKEIDTQKYKNDSLKRRLEKIEAFLKRAKK